MQHETVAASSLRENEFRQFIAEKENSVVMPVRPCTEELRTVSIAIQLTREEAGKLFSPHMKFEEKVSVLTPENFLPYQLNSGTPKDWHLC